MAVNTGSSESLVPSTGWKVLLRNTAYIIAALAVFLFALDLMISSLQLLGKSTAETIILATTNPFTGLFIGLLVTAIIQSSSATTAMVVALVASGSISLQGAVPIIMGANIGTTITSTIVSLGFITKKKEFRRAVAAGTYHDFFNILTAFILFPLEYFYRFLSSISHYIASQFFNIPDTSVKKSFSLLGSGFNPVIQFLVSNINSGFLLALLSIALLYGSILFFRKVLSQMLGFGSQDRVQRFFFKNPLKSFVWGLLTTALIRSSTITTSLVVPLVAKKVVKLRAAVPFILGANIGTTITAFIAAYFNSNLAISIAIAHFLFNFIGVALFMFVPFVKEIPINLANGLGRLTLRYRLAGFLYLLLTFFFIPFSLIYMSKDSIRVRELTFQQKDILTGQESINKVIVKSYINQPASSWMVYDDAVSEHGEPTKLVSVFRRKNLLIINNELFEFNKPGFCRDGEEKGKYKMCINSIIPHLSLNTTLTVDSVYVYTKTFYPEYRSDSVSTYFYISAVENILVKKESRDARGRLLTVDQLLKIEEK